MMFDEICIYNNKIFLTQEAYLIAYSYEKKAKLQKENFHECLKLEIPVKYMDIKDIKLKVIDNYVTGLKSLIILAFDCRGLNNAYIYCDAFKKKLFHIVLPEWPMIIGNYLNNVFMSDGPTFLTDSGGTFNFHSVPCGKSKRFDPHIICPNSREYKILQFQSFKLLHNCMSRGLLSLLVMCCNYSDKQSIKFVGFISEKNTPAVKYEQLNLDLFFPQYYESVLKAVEISKVFFHFKTNSLCGENVKKVESTSVTCTRSECLVFINAVLIYCCNLSIPLLHVMCLKTEFIKTPMSSENLVLAFENMTVFFIAVTKSIHCKVVKYWTDVEIAIFGDILRKGSKQIFLIKQFNIVSWQNNCILYDMLSLIPIDLLHHNTMPDDCLKITISGLEKKIQAGLTAIKETEHEISQKTAATIDALIKLSEFRINNEYLKCSNTFQESLVNLILSNVENKNQSACLEYEQHVKLLGEEHRFINNQWIICLFLMNDGTRVICNPSVKVLIRSNEVACIQKLFINGSVSSCLSNEYSREIHPKIKFSILLCFEFSILHGDEEVLNILTWYSGSEDEFNNEIFITEGRKVLVQHQLCHRTNISLASVLNYNIKRGISSPDDLLFARASQQRISLLVSSLHSNISQLEKMLMKTNFQHIGVSLIKDSSGKYVAFSNEKSLLFGTHLFLKKCSHNMIEIEAFTKTEKEICLLIHYLYQHLPGDVTISPCLKYKDEFSDLKRNVITSMKSEIDLLLSSFNIHNITEEVRHDYPKLMSSENAGTICIPKATYQRIRTAVIKKECTTDTLFKCVN